MSKYVVLLLLCMNGLAVVAQKSKHAPSLQGFERVECNGKEIYVAVHETTNGQWRDYVIDALKIMESSSQTGQLEENPFNKCFTEMLYKRDVLYRDTLWKNEKGKTLHTELKCSQMPVTGVSFEQAQDYCAYLNSFYSARWPLLTFRLPTPDEMTALLSAQRQGFDDTRYSYENPFITGINPEGCIVFNHKHDSWCKINLQIRSKYGYAVPFPVKWYFPNKKGIYDLQGNVAEMTSEKGVAMGGSCQHVAAECQPGVVNRYASPAYWLGFRVVAEMK